MIMQITSKNQLTISAIHQSANQRRIQFREGADGFLRSSDTLNVLWRTDCNKALLDDSLPTDLLWGCVVGKALA